MLENSRNIEQKPDSDEKKPAAAANGSDEEDWDKEMEGLNLGTYNPMEKVVKENIPFNAQGRNKSGRRDIRSMQRLGDKEGLNHVVNSYEEVSSVSNGASYIPVGMSECSVKKGKNKKK